jgi:hypothetical protein
MALAVLELEGSQQSLALGRSEELAALIHGVGKIAAG